SAILTGGAHLAEWEITLRAGFLLGAVLFPGCVFGNRDVALGPVAPATEERLATAQSIAIHVTDARDPSRRLVVGHPNNADGVETADVVPDKDPAKWLEECLAEELQRAGFDVVASAPLRLNADLQACDAEAYVSYVARIEAGIQLMRGERELLPRTEYVGKAKG